VGKAPSSPGDEETYLDSFSVGETCSLTRSVGAEDVEMFARVSGDDNPVHLDEVYAAGTRFKKRIAHGMLAASYISALLGSRFPGPGTIYLKQTLAFLRPVYLDDVIEVRATVTQYRADKQILTLETDCFNQHGEKVVSGEAVCLTADVKRG
jgi:3-hydroxybutyryl-CoA dehydratase